MDEIIKVVLGTTEFENVSWNIDPISGEGKLIISTELSLAELAGIAEGASQIEVYENEEQTGLWRKIALNTIRQLEVHDEGDPRRVEIVFSIVGLTQSAEAALNEGLSGSEDAILELAELFASIESVQTEAQEYLEQYRSRVEDTIHSFDEKSDLTDAKFNQQIALIEAAQTMVSDLEIAVNKVQDAVATMPKNVNERIGEIESTYNTLADRVARLENKLEGSN